MIGLLLMVILTVVVSKLVYQNDRFLNDFAGLLLEPTFRRGWLGFFLGRSYVSGRYKGREVAVRLNLKRNEYDSGYLVVAVRTSVPITLSREAVSARTRDDDGRHALDSLTSHHLFPSIDEGWLKVLWEPFGFFIFPGRFSEKKWREVLDSMHTLATSLEAFATSL